ncbi:MAG: hypothetical protein M5T61_17380 [Acidimicrobiia bacterium]|nr:hypothetical protein [Acidimicrobiia bacterium]
MRTNQIPNTVARASGKSHDSGVCSISSGQRAEGAIGPERWNVPVDSWKGPRTSQFTIWIAIRFNKRVEMISLTERRAQSTAAIPAQSAPPATPARTARGRWITMGRLEKLRPTQVARIPPARICPSKPMLTR